MKKKLLSTLVYASLACVAIGLPNSSHASPLTTNAPTQIRLHGFAYTEFALDKQMTNLPDLSNMPLPDANGSSTELYKETYNKTNAQAESWLTRLCLKIKNRDKGISGLIVGDFKGKTASGGRGNFRLRQAWVEQSLGNLKVRIGQAYILEETRSSITFASVKPAGFNNRKMKRVPLIRVSTAISGENYSLNLAFALESGNKEAVASGDDKRNNALFVNRYIIPYPAARAILTFNTGIGSPASLYVWGSLIPVHLSTKTGEIIDSSKTSYAFGVGLKLPVSLFRLGFNYHHTEGATGYSGLSNYQPASYYLSEDNSVKKTKTDAFNFNMIVKLAKTLYLGGEYDYVKFKNCVFKADPVVKTIIGNIKIKTTKVTMVELEWRHVKTENFDVVGTGDDGFAGEQVYAIYKYVF